MRVREGGGKKNDENESKAERSEAYLPLPAPRSSIGPAPKLTQPISRP